MAENSSIIICGKRYDVGQKVITYEEDPLFDARQPHCAFNQAVILPSQPYKGLPGHAMRYRARTSLGQDQSLPRLQQVLRQFVVHHDGMFTSKDTFRVLHDERGLSVHFLVDNDGTIYQTLDLVWCGYQAAGVNEFSVGVELCNRGDALQFPDAYSHGPQAKWPREKRTCTINGHQWLAFDYTKEQYQAMVNIARTLARIFPQLPQAIPQDASGEPIWDTLGGGNLDEVKKFAGYLGHYHVTNNKWDPGPFDFKKFVSQIRGRTFYPALPKQPLVEIPDDESAADDQAKALYKNSETEADGGFFPVGPMGRFWVWHAGVHLADERGKPVVAPFAGKIVAARQKAEDDWPQIGSPNFVLLKHDMNVAGSAVTFYTLLFHLDAEKEDAEGLPSWIRNGKSKPWFDGLKSGAPTALDEPVSAGEVIGHFGEAGPKGARHGQVHFEMFAAEELGAKIGDSGAWAVIEGAQRDRRGTPIYTRFCVEPSLTTRLDAWIARRGTVQSFFAASQNAEVTQALHKWTVHHRSEWWDAEDFRQSILQLPYWTARQKELIYQDQVQALAWWTPEIASAAGLPEDHVVYAYHPVAFVAWLHEKMKGQVQTAKAIQSETAFAGKKPPAEIKDDTSEGAEGFADDEDALFGDAAKNLDLERLAEGYPD